ncbi:inhibin beta chain [Anthonomus grandis grandis]|uniref:inhibin beta chain n=1 Tax=Anthonomus grandis grandis TaxID=2921223 RepID=UPI0021655250|nr:inhibin beta chain [Anthonomus grandis grandis]
MAVYRNYYNRRTLSWTVMVSCLYLLCSTAIGTVSSSMANGEKLRHHHMKNQIEKNPSGFNDAAKAASLGCPNCLLYNKHDKDKERIESDKLRLEAIKKQILQKLGLSAKPNVTHSLPREVVLETLSRAEEGDFFSKIEEEEFPTTSEKIRNNMETVDVDDFYGRTSEIISFAEQGSWVNQNRLLEFQVSPEAGSQMGQDFKVREAILWLKADLIKMGSTKCRSTDIYVFKIISNRLPESVSLSSKQFDRLTSEPVSVTLDELNSGWQKIDLTDTVRRWLSESSKDKLRLFVDCSCCAHWYVHLFNEDRDTRSNPNRPFLVIHTDPNTAKRVRRRAIDCSVDSGNQCCKQRFYVSFKALGWEDWVIAPQGYYANYCRGDCGHHRTPDTFVTYHTHVIEEVRKTQHLSGMTPCCAPLKFSSMSLIYYGPESTIIKRDLPKMVVDECGCP